MDTTRSSAGRFAGWAVYQGGRVFSTWPNLGEGKGTSGGDLHLKMFQDCPFTWLKKKNMKQRYVQVWCELVINEPWVLHYVTPFKDGLWISLDHKQAFQVCQLLYGAPRCWHGSCGYPFWTPWWAAPFAWAGLVEMVVFWSFELTSHKFAFA